MRLAARARASAYSAAALTRASAKGRELLNLTICSSSYGSSPDSIAAIPYDTTSYLVATHNAVKLRPLRVDRHSPSVMVCVTTATSCWGAIE